MDRKELKENLEKLLEQLEEEEGNVLNHFLTKFGANTENWTIEQDEEYEKTQKPLWNAGEELSSAIVSLEE